MSPRPGDVSVTVVDPGWDSGLQTELRHAVEQREAFEEEASHQRKQAGEWEAAAKAQASLVSGLKADVEAERRAHAKTQNELKSVETERRADRRDRSALASRLRAAEAAAATGGDRLAAVQALLAAREAELGRAKEELAESQAARAALQVEERRLALAVTSLGGRVESEVEVLRAEVAALKRAAASREALLAELTSQGKAARAAARQREDELGARLAAAEEEASKQRASCESAMDTLARLRSILLQSDRASGAKNGN